MLCVDKCDLESYVDCVADNLLVNLGLERSYKSRNDVRPHVWFVGIFF